jgi:hypothetical protein
MLLVNMVRVCKWLSKSLVWISQVPVTLLVPTCPVWALIRTWSGRIVPVADDRRDGLDLDPQVLQSRHMFSKRSFLVSLLLLPFVFAGTLQVRRGYKDRPNLTPLMNAAAHNDLARVGELLAHGADVKQRTDRGETALYEAIERYDPSIDNLPIVDALLKSGADPNEREIFDASALSVSLTRDYASPAVTLRLLEAGAVVPHDCGAEDSLLSLATQQSSVEVMRALIDSGASVNCRYQGASALYWAASNGEVDRVTLLLQHGADPTIQVGGKTVLEAATCPNCAPDVKAGFAKARELIEHALLSSPAKVTQ